MSVIPAIVLAAGLSRRMGGRPKALLPLDGGDTFLTRVVRTIVAAGVQDVIVVLGHDARAVGASLDQSALPVRMVVNDDYESGQLSSVLAGLTIVDRPGIVATLLTLVDVPLVTAATVRAVIECFHKTLAPIVRPTSAGRHGHPLLIHRSLFDAVRDADRARGIKPIVRAYASPQGDVPVDDPGAFLDIDTPEEYEAMIRDRASIGHKN